MDEPRSTPPPPSPPPGAASPCGRCGRTKRRYADGAGRAIASAWLCPVCDLSSCPECGVSAEPRETTCVGCTRALPAFRCKRCGQPSGPGEHVCTGGLL